jgi:hypothetical protein
MKQRRVTRVRSLLAGLLTFVATAAAPRAAHADPRAAYVAGGLAIVAAGVGTAFGVIALNDKSDFQRSPTFAKADQGNDFAAYADASFGAAVLLGATSIVLFLATGDGPATPAAQPATVASRKTFTFEASPVLFPHGKGGGAGAVLRF